MPVLKPLSLTAAVVLLAFAPARAEPAPSQRSDRYFQEGQKELAARLALKPDLNRPRNVILFIGDGMGISTLTAARILAGQRRGVDGESNKLTIDGLPYSALVKTYSHDSQVTDSAASATALLTGIKAGNDMIGLRAQARYDDCESARGAHATTLFEIAERAGLATGIVSTARLTHATPAAAYAHTPNRDWEHDATLPANARKSGCIDIARQLVEWPAGDGFEVMLGGGRSRFLRADGRDLTAEWRQARRDRRYVSNKAELNAVDPAATRQLLGLFAAEHMDYEDDRNPAPGGQPSLAEMTIKAINVLSRRNKGFLLLVEGGRIDHAHHAGNAARALGETLALDAAVKAALETVDLSDTLVVVTADHSHTMTISGYPKRGNPILGKVVDVDGQVGTGADGKPYTTLSYATGPGGKASERTDVRDADTLASDYVQPALVPLRSATHGGEDVSLHAIGPSAHLFRGNMDQPLVFHVLASGLGLSSR